MLQSISSRLAWTEQGCEVQLDADTPGARPPGEPLHTSIQLKLLGSAVGGGEDNGRASSGRAEALLGTMPSDFILWVRVPAWAHGAEARAEGALALLSTESSEARGDGAEAAAAAAPPSGSPRAIPPSTLLPVAFSSKAGASAASGGASGVLGKLSLRWHMRAHWKMIADSRARFQLLHAPMFGPLVLAGLTHGERCISANATLIEVPAVARRQLISLQVPAASAAAAASSASTAAAASKTAVSSAVSSSRAPDPSQACLVTRWEHVWILHSDKTRSFLLSPPKPCVQRASPIGEIISEWAQRGGGTGPTYKLSAAESLDACDAYEGCLDNGASPFAAGFLFAMHNGSGCPLALTSDPPRVSCRLHLNAEAALRAPSLVAAEPE